MTWHSSSSSRLHTLMMVTQLYGTRRVRKRCSLGRRWHTQTSTNTQGGKRKSKGYRCIPIYGSTGAQASSMSVPSLTDDMDQWRDEAARRHWAGGCEDGEEEGGFRQTEGMNKTDHSLETLPAACLKASGESERMWANEREDGEVGGEGVKTYDIHGGRGSVWVIGRRRGEGMKLGEYKDGWSIQKSRKIKYPRERFIDLS